MHATVTIEQSASALRAVGCQERLSHAVGHSTFSLHAQAVEGFNWGFLLGAKRFGLPGEFAGSAVP